MEELNQRNEMERNRMRMEQMEPMMDRWNESTMMNEQHGTQRMNATSRWNRGRIIIELNGIIQGTNELNEMDERN